MLALVASGCSGNAGSGVTDSSPSDPPKAATAGGSATTTTAKPKGTLTLRVSTKNSGPWSNSISIALPADLVPLNFFTCGVWSRVTPKQPCTTPPKGTLPAATLLRLEQRPIGPSTTNPDNPGWGTVGTSDAPGLSVPLSNFVNGNKAGTTTYRVTLRPLAGGPALATSNEVTVTWHK